MIRRTIAAILFAGAALGIAFAQSTIDPNVPATGSGLTSLTIRQQFAHAFNDINSIWAYLGFVPKQYPVTKYGAKGDGATNDGPAFIATAAAACAATLVGSAEVYIPPAPGAGYSIQTPVAITSAICPQGVTFRGPGKFLPGIVVNNQSVDIFQGSVNNFTVRDLSFVGFGTPTAGIAINIAGQNLTVEDVNLDTLWWGILVNPSNTIVNLRHIKMRNINRLGMSLGGSGSSISYIDDFMYAGGSLVPYAGLQFTGGGAATVSNAQIFGASNCIDFAPTSSTVIATVDIVNSSIDHCTNGINSEPDATSTVQRISYTGGKITSHSGAGVTISGNTQGFVLNGPSFYDNQLPVTISGSGNNGLTVVGATLAGNRGPVTIGAGQSGFKINDNFFGPYAGWGNNVGCVTVAAGGSDHYSIQGNSCNTASPLTTTIVDGGTGTDKIVALNPGAPGTIPVNNMPALTGSCTTSAGSVATTCEQDGVPPAYTPTLGGTRVTTETVTANWHTIGTKLIFVNIVDTVTTVGAGTGIQTYTLPNGAVTPYFQGCSGYNASSGAFLSAWANGSTISLVPGTIGAFTYAITCPNIAIN